MMKTIFKTILLSIAIVTVSGLASCSDDEFTPTIFDTTEKPLDPTTYNFPLDSFIKREFLQPYNVKFIYRMEDIGSDLDKNLTPAPYDKSVQLAALSKYLWYDVYKELAGEHDVFLKKYSPRIIHVIGSKNYNPSQGTETLGVAEGGIKISLYNVNKLDVNDMETMNEYFFETMHHEFSHILDQTFLHPTSFNTISNGMYDAMGWGSTPDSVSIGRGFVSSYAASATGEDWVETIARYVTRDSVAWANMLNTASYDWELIDCLDKSEYESMLSLGCDLDTIGYYKESNNGQNKIYRRLCLRNADGTVVKDADGKPIWIDENGFSGKDVILKKLDLCREWLLKYYAIDLDKLRDMVQERMYVKNEDGTWKKNPDGSLVNRLTAPVDGYPRLIDKLTDEIYSIKK